MRGNRILVPAWHLVWRALTGLDRAIMPVCCVFCGVACRAGEQHICQSCAADLPWIRNACRTCATPLVSGTADSGICAACVLRPPPFTAARAPLAYEFPVDAAIKMFKFRRRLHYGPAFGAMISRAAATMPEDIDSVLPVPLHWLRHGQRGFNQAAEISRALLRDSGLSLIGSVRRVRRTPLQSGLGAAERRRNLLGAFAIRGDIAASHVLIVDDVITTGETCRQLARLLLENGAAKVSVIALARA